jgi:hypothetical protein
MAIDKSKWNKNIKVSQKTIDEIKKMGMSKALKTAAGAGAAGRNVNDASAKEWAEGLRRLYTPERVDKLMGSASKAAKSGPLSANTKVYTGPKKPAGQYSKSAAKSASSKAPAKNTLANYNKDTQKLPSNMSASGKSKSSKGLTPQKVAGTALGVAALVASRGRIRPAIGGLVKAAGKPNMSKMAAGNPNLKKSAAAAAEKPKAAAAKVTVGAKGSFGPTTKTMAKKGLGTPSEYASRAAQFGGPTNITIKKAAKKAPAKKSGKK